MSVVIHIETHDEGVTASLVGKPEWHAIEPTREKAIASLRELLRQRMAQGELVLLDLERQGVSEQAGIFADDPTLDDIVEEIYRLRDEDRDRLMHGVD